jgi:hypothetical protein
MPVDEITDERQRQPASRTASEGPPSASQAFVTETATLVPDAEDSKDDPTNPRTPASKRVDSSDREVTAISPNPSGPVAAQSGTPAILKSSNPFITDGGPTLTPSESESDDG